MPSATGPNLGLIFGFDDHDDGWGTSYNEAFAILDATMFLSVISAAIATPPGSPAAGDRYVVAASPTGAWSGHAKDLAVYINSAWSFYTPKTGWRAWDVATTQYIRFDGTNWVSDGSAVSSLDDLTDVVITSPTSGDVVKYDGTHFVNGTISSPSSLDDLTDVVITSPSSGQVVKYDGTHFVNGTISSVGSLDDLSDVIITSPASGQVVRNNGTNFANATLSFDDLSDVVITSPASGQVIKYDGTHFINGTVSSVGSFDDLSDVIITSPSSGQVVKYDGTHFVNGTISSASSLDDLTDVVITTPASGQVIRNNGTNFVNGSVAFDDLSDVIITSPASGQVIKYDGTHFINGTISSVGSLDDLTDVDAPSPSDGDSLVFNSVSGNWEPGSGTAGSDGSVYTTWNSADTSSGLVVSGLTLSGGTQSVVSGSRANKTIISGQKIFFDIVATAGNNSTGSGIADGSAALNDGGSTTHCVAVQTTNGNIWFNNGHPHTLGGMDGKVMRVAVDATLSPPQVWVKNITDNGDWNGTSGADPTTTTGGYVLTGMSLPIYPYGVIGASVADTVTGNFGLNDSFPGTVPSGFLPLGPIKAVGQEIPGLDTNVAVWLVTPSSANLRTAMTDESGTGALLFAGGALGTPASGTLTNSTGLPISTGITGFGTGIATALAVNVGSSGSPVINGGALGTPSSGTLTNATGLPVGTGISGLGTGVATFLATPTSANLASALTDETGSGANVFAVSPSLTTPAIGDATGSSLALSSSGASAFVVGGTAPTLNGSTARQHFTGSTTIVGLSRYSADAIAADFIFGKGRGSVSTAGAVQSGDNLGSFDAVGDDGSTNGALSVRASRWIFTVDGTVSTGVVPGGVELSTMNAAGSTATRFRIRSSGGTVVGSTSTDPGASNLLVVGTLGLGSSGDAVLARGGANLFGLGGATSSFPAIKRSGVIAQIRLGDDSDYAALEAATTRTKVYTVATLPTVGTAGRRAAVSDANATTFLSTVAGGGSNKVPVYDNGTNWVIG